MLCSLTLLLRHLNKRDGTSQAWLDIEANGVGNNSVGIILYLASSVASYVAVLLIGLYTSWYHPLLLIKEVELFLNNNCNTTLRLVNESAFFPCFSALFYTCRVQATPKSSSQSFSILR